MRHFVKGAHDAFRADAGEFVTAKRHLEAAEEAGAVDDCTAAFQGIRDTCSGFHVLGKDAAAEPEFGGVGDGNGLLFRIKPDDRHHRSEDFHVLCHIGSFGYVHEDGRLIEGTVSFAAEDDFTALLHGERHLLFYLDGSLFTDQAAHTAFFIGRVARGDSLDFFDCRLGKCLHQIPVYQKTLRSTADLTGVVHSAPDEFFGSKGDIRIFQYDKGIVTAQLQSYMSEVLCTNLRRFDSDLGRAGQGDQIDIRIGGERISNGRAGAGHDLDRACRHAGFV